MSRNRCTWVSGMAGSASFGTPEWLVGGRFYRTLAEARLASAAARGRSEYWIYRVVGDGRGGFRVHRYVPPGASPGGSRGYAWSRAYSVEQLNGQSVCRVC
jgi:hypothetical protein